MLSTRLSWDVSRTALHLISTSPCWSPSRTAPRHVTWAATTPRSRPEEDPIAPAPKQRSHGSTQPPTWSPRRDRDTANLSATGDTLPTPIQLLPTTSLAKIYFFQKLSPFMEDVRIVVRGQRSVLRGVWSVCPRSLRLKLSEPVTPASLTDDETPHTPPLSRLSPLPPSEHDQPGAPSAQDWVHPPEVHGGAPHPAEEVHSSSSPGGTAAAPASQTTQ